ncbi:SGNH/GDSL hydrolase family protein [Patescibacteria group bacterium]|nr:SGNH/GDSL hydrolase family protein [Patescibacteria group bacterium]
MKKLLIIFLITGIYLYISYSYFYNFLGQKHLTAPPHQTKTMLDNKFDHTIRYAALGDSLTAGVGAQDYKNSYPYLIAEKLSSKNNVELLNFAQVGATSNDVLANQLSQAVSSKPDIVTLFIGVNDIHNLKSTAEFRSNYVSLVAALAKTQAKVYVLSIPYLGSDKIVYFPYNFLLDYRTKQFNSIIKEAATLYNLKYLDLYALSKSSNLYSSDLFHPSDFGYQFWAKEIDVN